MRAIVICDGRGNAGTGARAAVLYDENMNKIDERAEKITPTTNIIAEHLSIQLGILLALEHGVTNLLILNDSQTPINHLNGTYKVRKENIRPHVNYTWDLARKFDSIEIRWVPRSETSAADKLCRIVDPKKSAVPAKRDRPGGPAPQEIKKENPFAGF